MVEGSVKYLSSEGLRSFGTAWVICLEETCVQSQSWHLHVDITKDHQKRRRSQRGGDPRHRDPSMGESLSNSLGGADSSMTAGWVDRAALREMQGYLKQ